MNGFQSWRQLDVEDLNVLDMNENKKKGAAGKANEKKFSTRSNS